ncbi:hypothetical protein LJC63_03880 [Ruminococcaceae bacterium OttesenSCG-928-L11]|nr:hypothetical protein [Ruminococcaceae bacterium OttesenSCG-928-L11]
MDNTNGQTGDLKIRLLGYRQAARHPGCSSQEITVTAYVPDLSPDAAAETKRAVSQALYRIFRAQEDGPSHCDDAPQKEVSL